MRLGIKFILFLKFILFSGNSYACDCQKPSRRDTSVVYGLQNYNLIFLGEIIESNHNTYSIKILELYKGSVESETIYGGTRDNCSVIPAKGLCIVFANRDKNSFLDIRLCSPSLSLNTENELPDLPLTDEKQLDWENAKANFRMNRIEDWNYCLIKLGLFKKAQTETNMLSELKYIRIMIYVFMGIFTLALVTLFITFQKKIMNSK